MEAEQFKKAVGKFPTGVTVISTIYKEKSYGFTANSFTSVSLNPSLISFCLKKNAGSYDAFSNTNHITINILSEEQSDISNHFAKQISDKFTGEYIKDKYSFDGNFKNPVIHGSNCYIECKKYKQIECGDHDIFILEAIHTNINNEKPPLVYYAKSYKKIL